ncbi:hypothetical protein QOZ95_005619 [Paenibacillus brasilensis]|uniref:Integrase catalytic domain-containing protein n=2 Tax=Paenibacillus brasilensis TaxID=128574 RepID=A0ABU0L804_9BACL|nr:hypothetical protein [Paenibacillus brasilensis]
MEFQSFDHLEVELYDYVNWLNNYRIHGTLGYMTPAQYRQEALKKLSDLLLTIQILGGLDIAVGNALAEIQAQEEKE